MIRVVWNRAHAVGEIITWTRLFTLTGGYLAVAHYARGVWFTLWVAWISNDAERDYYLRFLTPYLGITAIFVAGIVLGHQRRTKAALTAMLLGLAVSVAMCAYDLSHWERAQQMGGGTGRTYFMWWWYYEPFWYGYKPGNV